MPIAMDHDAMIQFRYQIKGSDSMARIPVVIPDEHHEFLRELAHIKRSSMAEEIRNAIAEYVSKSGQEEKYRHIKLDMTNPPDDVRKQMRNRFEGGKISD